MIAKVAYSIKIHPLYKNCFLVESIDKCFNIRISNI